MENEIMRGKMNLKVSIIVPIYNAQKTLERCIESILNQDFSDFELLLINDGSKDDSGKICDAYAKKDHRVRVIHKENSGVSASRNLALQEAKGEYLQFLDADDWITPNATRLLVESLEQNHCDMVIADFYRVIKERLSHKGSIDEDGVLSREEFANFMMENPADFYYGVLWNKLYKKSIIEKQQLCMNPKISWCEDFMFNLEYIRHCENIFVLQVPIYYYVKTKGSLVSQSMSLTKTIKTKMMVFEYYTDFYKQVLTEEEYEKKRLQIYSYLMDMASDEIVPPTLLSNSKKLGQERSLANAALGDDNNYFAEDYRNRKLMAYYIEPVAIKYDLTLEEARVLLVLSHQPVVKHKKELAEFLEISMQRLAIVLNKLRKNEYVKVSKKRGKEQLEILFFESSEKLIEELKIAESQFETVRFSGLTERETQEYQRLAAKIKENTLNIILK